MRSIRIFLVAALVVGAMGLMGAALAQSDEQPPNVLPKRINNQGPNNGNDVLPEFFSRPGERAATAPSALPFTGADLALFAGAGLVAIGGGVALVRRTRRRSPAV